MTHDVSSKTLFGFWVYLLTDFMMFSALFATYAVLNQSTYGGPSARELFSPTFALVQTLLLLMASLTSGLAGVAAHRREERRTLVLFGLTFLFGLLFLSLQWSEASRLVQEGNSWKRSAFLSAFFTLVGTHGLHVLFALLWIPILALPVWRYGLDETAVRRFTCLRMFWQFLSVVWIFIFSFVYLMGSYG